MLTELIELSHKMKEQMKATQSEIKQNIQGTNSDREETRTQINDFEQKEEINIQPEQNEETRIQKNEERLRKLWDNFKCSNIRIIGVPEEEEEEQEIENLFEQKLSQSGEGNRLPGSPEIPKENRPKEEHIKAHHKVTQG